MFEMEKHHVEKSAKRAVLFFKPKNQSHNFFQRV